MSLPSAPSEDSVGAIEHGPLARRLPRPLIYILRPKVPFQFLLGLLGIEKPARAKVSSHEQQTNDDC